MIATTFLTLLALAWIARNLILGFLAGRDRARVKHTRNKERTRRQFAEARNALTELAIARDIDMNSVSFRFFYYINTAFMRRPDQYREVSDSLVKLFLSQHDSSSGDELLAESKNWTPAFKAIVRMTADALGYVVIDYSWFPRVMFRMERRLDARSTPFRMLNSWRKGMAEKEKPIADISHTREAMYRMADNPLAFRGAH